MRVGIAAASLGMLVVWPGWRVASQEPPPLTLHVESTLGRESETAVELGVECGSATADRAAQEQCFDARRELDESCANECKDWRILGGGVPHSTVTVNPAPASPTSCREVNLGAVDVAIVSCEIESSRCTCDIPLPAASPSPSPGASPPLEFTEEEPAEVEIGSREFRIFFGE